MIYATHDELKSYIGDGYPLPDETARLRERASELIESTTLHQGHHWWADPLPNPLTDQQTALRDAVCAQVEFWLETGESIDISRPKGGQMGIRMGEFWVADLPDELGPRAKRALRRAGLLDRRVGVLAL